MFDTIRSMVDQKRTFLETANILLDEATGIPDDFFAEGHNSDPEPRSEQDDERTEHDEEHDDDHGEHEDDLGGEGGNDDGEGADEDEPGIGNDMMSIRFSTDNKLPKLSGADDLLSVTIDLGTNTSPDTLPVPPINAGDAIADDPLSTRIPDGFDNSDVSTRSEVTVNDDIQVPDDVMGTAVEESAVIEPTGGDTKFTEAITLDGAAPAAGEEVPPAEPDGKDGKENNPVTDAVIDKVAESEAGEEVPPAESDLEVSSKLQDKLDKLQKDIIGVKELVKKGFAQ